MLRALALIWLVIASPASAEEATIAVAANFLRTMERLEADFEARTGQELVVVSGSTGQLYAQIRHGAPFDVFLSADVERVDALEAAGGIVEGERFTYAVGRLVLAGRGSAAPMDGSSLPGAAALLALPGDRRLAIANPELAPYGRAALQVLDRLGSRQAWEADLVYGQSVGQAFAFMLNGDVDWGLVPRSMALDAPDNSPLLSWEVPADLHDPIRQDAALLRRGAGNPVARGFFDYLRSAEARAKIGASGYDLD